jgi:hypothetical protein
MTYRDWLYWQTSLPMWSETEKYGCVEVKMW